MIGKRSNRCREMQKDAERVREMKRERERLRGFDNKWTDRRTFAIVESISQLQIFLDRTSCPQEYGNKIDKYSINTQYIWMSLLFDLKLIIQHAYKG